MTDTKKPDIPIAVQTNSCSTESVKPRVTNPAPLPLAMSTEPPSPLPHNTKDANRFKKTLVWTGYYLNKRCWKGDVVWVFLEELKDLHKARRLSEIPEEFKSVEAFCEAIQESGMELSEVHYNAERRYYLANEPIRRRRKPKGDNTSNGKPKKAKKSKKTKGPKEVEELVTASIPVPQEELGLKPFIPSFEEWFHIGQRMGYLTHVLASYRLEVAPRVSPTQD